MEEMRLPSAFKAPKLSTADETDQKSAFSKPSPSTVGAVPSADANTTAAINPVAMPCPFPAMPPMEFFQHFQQAALQAMARNMTPATTTAAAPSSVPTTSLPCATGAAGEMTGVFNGNVPPMAPFGFSPMPNFFGFPPSPYPFSPAFIPSPASFLPSFSGKRKRRHRTIFSEDQLSILENTFADTPYPDVGMREKLALQCELKEERVEVWFKNRRAKKRKMDREGAHDATVGSHSSDGKEVSDLSDYTSDNEDVERAAHHNHNGGGGTNHSYQHSSASSASSASHPNSRHPSTTLLSRPQQSVTCRSGRRVNKTTTLKSFEDDEEEKIIITPSKNVGVKASPFSGKNGRTFNGMSVAAAASPRVTTNGGFGSAVALKRKMLMNRNASPTVRFAAAATNGRGYIGDNSDAKRVRGTANSIATGTTKFKPVSELFKD